MRNRTILFTTLLAVTIFFSCGNISDKKIRIAYANWAEGIAVTYLAKEILSEQGYRTELLNADIAPIFTSLARGKTDVFMDSWMPVTHADYFQRTAQSRYACRDGGAYGLSDSVCAGFNPHLNRRVYFVGALFAAC